MLSTFVDALVDVGLHIRFTRFGDGSGAPVDEFAFFLRFGQPLAEGAQYTLAVSGLVDESGNAMITSYHTLEYSENMHNPNVKVNQQGYTLGRPKVGYVGGYGGDLGGRVFAAGAQVFGSSKGFGGDWTDHSTVAGVSSNYVIIAAC